ncbi:MAG: CaiB/BaiF CoA-transferase family protein [Dehalococcoidia bacterium]|jgi:crotonobetainyl-CoA:carnitine CoA-transferase CaiB-like acyl-CoA transferase
MQALEGIRILELVHMPPGELCTMILGDMGAEVVKVEAFTPDDAPVPDAHDAEALKTLQAFNALNRNKKSVRINLKSEQGKEVFYRLAGDADVIVEGFRPGVVKRMGVDYETVNKLNPRIIYCSLSGYGQDGPYSQYPGHDINYISIAGALNLIGWPEEPPAIPLNLLADFAGASMHGATGILTALFARERTGKGQYIDISYTDSVINLMTFFLQQHFAAGYDFPRGAWALAGGYPYYKTYQAKDGKLISLGCIEPWFWENFCRAIGREDLKGLSFDLDHLGHRPQDTKWKAAEEELKKIFLTKTRDEWFDLLIKSDVPVGKVYSMDEIFSDPQLLHRRMLLEFDHPRLGKVKQPGIAIKLSGTPGEVRSLAPYPGEHTDEVLKSSGFSEAELESLRKSKAIG